MKPMMICKHHGEVYPTDKYGCPHCLHRLTDTYRHGPVGRSILHGSRGAIATTAIQYYGGNLKETM